MPTVLRIQYRKDLISNVLARFKDVITASRFPDILSEINVGSKSITLLDVLSIENVQAAFPRSLPKESGLRDSTITSKIQESFA